MVMSYEDLKKDLANKENKSGRICHICGKVLPEDREELRKFENKDVHVDCYFDKLGDGLEKNPLSKLGIKGPSRGNVD